METVGVSILCLAFNHEPYIADALEGFLMQKTTFPYEIIIHEDASTDGTARIIREYEKKYPDMIKPIYQTENQYSKGVNINDRFMLPMASGRYVALCDGDDYWTDPLKLQKQYDAMEANPGCLMCLHRVLDRNTLKGSEQETRYLPAAALSTGVIPSREFFRLLGGNDFFNEVCYFFRADEYRRYQAEYPDFARLYMKNKSDDAPMLYYFAYMADVYYIADVMAVYRRFNAGSWSDSMSGKTTEEQLVFYQNASEAQKAFETFSNGIYNHELTYTRMYTRFQYERCMGHYKQMLAPCFDCVWARQPKSYRTRIVLLSRFPALAGLVFRIYI